MVKMLTVLVGTVSNSKVFLLEKLLTFFSKNVSVYAIFNDQSFNDMLTNDVVSFEQLGTDYDHIRLLIYYRFQCFCKWTTEP